MFILSVTSDLPPVLSNRHDVWSLNTYFNVSGFPQSLELKFHGLFFNFALWALRPRFHEINGPSSHIYGTHQNFIGPKVMVQTGSVSMSQKSKVLIRHFPHTTPTTCNYINDTQYSTLSCTWACITRKTTWYTTKWSYMVDHRSLVICPMLNNEKKWSFQNFDCI